MGRTPLTEGELMDGTYEEEAGWVDEETNIMISECYPSEEEVEISIVPRDNVKFPPPEGYDGVQHPVECTSSGCDFWGDMNVEFGKSITGTCPKCGSELQKDFSRHMWGIDSRGRGFSETKIGQRIKKDRIARSERLAKTQWDNVNPGNVVNPDRVVNPTEGGVFDPNSKFNRHKKKNTKIIYPGGKA
jgi:hypothetical protein